MHALRADSWWGVAALLWLGTGIPRAFTPLEKGPTYYLSNHFFFAKMGLFALILALELWPMVSLIRWRIAIARGVAPDTRHARTFARISTLQAFLIILMVAAATAMARGLGVH
jgi:putative membrane protein